jgi:predicted TIM-barrel fold metal-dependent hydrolase
MLQEATCAPADPAPRSPGFRAPPDACDCHFHVFGPHELYPYAADRSYTPPDASVDAYRHLQRVLGVTRGVIIQPSVYGTDNSRTLAAAAELGPQVRIVSVIDDAATTDHDLEAMHRAGVRGVRLNLLFRGGISLGSARRIADRIRDLGWHIQLLADVTQFDALAAFVEALNVPVVFDHMGHVPPGTPTSNAGVQTLLSLLREDRAWVKLSGSYRLTGQRLPPYSDVTPLARALVGANSRRCVWGSDWPHPAIGVPMPNDGDLFDLLPVWVEDAAILQDVLVSNPARLYDFG